MPPNLIRSHCELPPENGWTLDEKRRRLPGGPLQGRRAQTPSRAPDMEVDAQHPIVARFRISRLEELTLEWNTVGETDKEVDTEGWHRDQLWPAAIERKPSPVLVPSSENGS